MRITQRERGSVDGVLVQDSRGVLFLKVRLRAWETGGQLAALLTRGWVIADASDEERALLAQCGLGAGRVQ